MSEPDAGSRSSHRSSVIVVLALFALYVIWGSTYLAMRVALETLPPFLMAGPRFIVAGLAMYVFLRARGAPRPTWKEWGASAKVGVLLLTFGNGAVAVAETSVPSGVAAVVVASMPIWAAVFGRLAGLPASGREWLGLALGFAGVVVLNLGGGLVLDVHGLILLVAPLAWAAGSVWSKRLVLPAGGMATATQMIVGGATMLLLAVVTGERLDHMPSARSIGAVVYLAVFGSIVAFSAYTWLLRNVRPALATSYAYVNPLVAVVLGWLVAGEPVGVSTLVAAALSLTAVALIARPSAPKASASPRPTPDPAGAASAK